MAQMKNNIIIEGNLVADVELRFTENGRSVAKGRIASTRTYEVGGEQRDDTTFITIEAWGRTAEELAERFGKGDRITVSGRLAQDTWTTEDGQKRSAYKIVVQDVYLSIWSKKLRPEESGEGEESDPAPTADFEPGDAPF